MQLRFSIVLILMLLVGSGAAIAQAGQMSKEEAKKWKTLAKTYKKNPEALKALTEERDRYKQEVQELQSQVYNMESAQTQNNGRLSQLEQENLALNNQLSMAEDRIRELNLQMSQAPSNPTPPRPQTASQDDYNVGTVYRVQVGAFSRDRIPAKFLNMSDAMIEDAGNLQKVLVGNYRPAPITLDSGPSVQIHPYRSGLRERTEVHLPHAPAPQDRRG